MAAVRSEAEELSQVNDLATQSVLSEAAEPLSPLDVAVKLAGEVPGLKPPAVARAPKPPRLFVVNRSGEATEIVSDAKSFPSALA